MGVDVRRQSGACGQGGSSRASSKTASKPARWSATSSPGPDGRGDRRDHPGLPPPSGQEPEGGGGLRVGTPALRPSRRGSPRPARRARAASRPRGRGKLDCEAAAREDLGEPTHLPGVDPCSSQDHGGGGFAVLDVQTAVQLFDRAVPVGRAARRTSFRRTDLVPRPGAARPRRGAWELSTAGLRDVTRAVSACTTEQSPPAAVRRPHPRPPVAPHPSPGFSPEGGPPSAGCAWRGSTARAGRPPACGT